MKSGCTGALEHLHRAFPTLATVGPLRAATGAFGTPAFGRLWIGLAGGFTEIGRFIRIDRSGIAREVSSLQ